MEQYSTCQTMLISTSIFIGSIGLRELMEDSYGGWHNWFCAHLVERYSCMHPIIYSFIQQTCQILGIKRKLRFSSDLQRVHCLVSESLHQFLLWPNLTVLCCPLRPCPQGPRSSFVPGSSQALFADPPPPLPIPSPFCLWV